MQSNEQVKQFFEGKWQNTFSFYSQVSMIAVTVGFVIGKAISPRQSPIYKAVLDLDTGMCLPCVSTEMFREPHTRFLRYCVTFDTMR